MPASTRLDRSDLRATAGFTLAELLTSLVVLGTGISIFISMFLSSDSLAKVSRSHELAASFAQEYLAEIQAHPESYYWPNYDGKVGEHQPVQPKNDEDVSEHSTDFPIAMPTIRRAYDRERRFHLNFTWAAFARLPEEDANYVEVLVQISWLENAKVKRFYLASAIPRTVAEGIN